MKSIQIRQLRSLTDTGSFELKPITLLVGTNSSGKSTFLRTFPLLKQSIETPTNSPILWYGRYVDFGTFELALSNQAQARTITFKFEFDLDSDPRIKRRIQESNHSTETVFPVFAEVVLGKRQDGEGTTILSCNLTVDGTNVTIEYGSGGRLTGLKVGEIDCLKEVSSLSVIGSFYFIPKLGRRDEGDANEEPVYQPYSGERRRVTFRYGLSGPLDRVAVRQLRAHLRVPLGGEQLSRIASTLSFGSRAAVHWHLLQHLSSANATEALGRVSFDSQGFNPFFEAVLARALPDLLDALDVCIAKFASNVSYMGPLRATAQRDYRVQDLAVRELDFQGENLAMFLRTLTPDERRSLAAFSQTHFGFEVSIHAQGGHVAVGITERGANAHVNLTDTGFGYSQVLPVIAQVWASYGRSRRQSIKQQSKLLALEQPELHLHPAYQAKIADLLIGALRAARSSGGRLQIVVETHSEALVNRVGSLIRQGAVGPGDVQVAVFDQDRETQSTSVSFASFDDEGALRNWPYGFFSPEP